MAYPVRGLGPPLDGHPIDGRARNGYGVAFLQATTIISHLLSARVLIPLCHGLKTSTGRPRLINDASTDTQLATHIAEPTHTTVIFRRFVRVAPDCRLLPYFLPWYPFPFFPFYPLAPFLLVFPASIAINSVRKAAARSHDDWERNPTGLTTPCNNGV
ncbi:hypothetical protein B0H14DRAFT_3520282 [Mycena olivaceomarginata]|nr:hypothetical protein B0H14DRAFT_3520282 [Mycena olivaceomarginata]